MGADSSPIRAKPPSRANCRSANKGRPPQTASAAVSGDKLAPVTVISMARLSPAFREPPFRGTAMKNKVPRGSPRRSVRIHPEHFPNASTLYVGIASGGCQKKLFYAGFVRTTFAVISGNDTDKLQSGHPRRRAGQSSFPPLCGEIWIYHADSYRRTQQMIFYVSKHVLGKEKTTLPSPFYKIELTGPVYICCPFR